MNTRTVSLLGWAIVTAAGGAFAQSAASGGGFDRPLSRRSVVVQPEKAKAEKAKIERQQATSTLNISRADETGTYTVTIEGDDLSASINGEEVPQGRVQRDDHSVRLLDEHGKVVAEFQVRQDQGQWKAFRGEGFGGDAFAGGQWRTPEPGQEGEFFKFAGVAGDEPPPVMIGITMGQPSEEVLEKLGLDEGTVVLIDKVYEGLPAELAGLKDSDILVELDGQKPLDEGRVRKILGEKKPGEVVKLKVLRGGESKTIKVELAPYDAGKLSGGLMPMAPQDMQGLYTLGWNAGPGHDARRSIEEALQGLAHGGGHDPEKMHEHIRLSLEEALKSLDRYGGLGALGPRAAATPDGAQGRILLGDRPGQVFVGPRARSGGDADVSKQLDELKTQLEEVQRSRDEIKGQLDEIKAMLREMRDHR